MSTEIESYKICALQIERFVTLQARNAHALTTIERFECDGDYSMLSLRLFKNKNNGTIMIYEAGCHREDDNLHHFSIILIILDAFGRDIDSTSTPSLRCLN